MSKCKPFANYPICIKHPFIKHAEWDSSGTNSLKMKTKEGSQAAIKVIHQSITSHLCIAFYIVLYKGMSLQEPMINSGRVEMTIPQQIVICREEANISTYNTFGLLHPVRVKLGVISIPSLALAYLLFYCK